MTIFETAKTIPFTQVLDGLGIHVDRGYYLCPFHDDQKPSAKIYTRSNDSNCFVCQKNIDAINLYSDRFNLSPLLACKKLLSDFSITFDDRYVYKEPVKTTEQIEDEIVLMFCNRINAITFDTSKDIVFSEVMYCMEQLKRPDLTNCTQEILLNHIKGLTC